MVSERGVLGVGPLLAGQAARCRVGSPRVVLAVRRDVLAFQSWNTDTKAAEEKPQFLHSNLIQTNLNSSKKDSKQIQSNIAQGHFQIGLLQIQLKHVVLV